MDIKPLRTGDAAPVDSDQLEKWLNGTEVSGGGNFLFTRDD